MDMDGTSEGLESRLEAMETRIAFQDNTIQSLSETVYDQEQRLERLERLLRDLRDRFKDVAEQGLPAMPHNQKPPHY